MDDRQLREKVMVLIGAASTCWKGGTGDSEFESDQAVALGEEFIAELKASPYLPASGPPPPKEKRMQPPSIGRIVHYVTIGEFTLLEGGLTRAATVVNVGRHLGGDAPLEGNRANLQVLTDGTNDWAVGRSRSPDDPVQHVELTRWVTNVEYDEAGRPGTWHWPPQVKPETRGELSAVMGGVKLDK